MGLWRSQRGSCSDDKHGRSIHDFEAERPVCDRCGTDGREFPQIVIKLECVHYERIVDRIGAVQVGSKELACKPGKPIAPGTVRSSSARAVNCKDCRKTPEWREGMQAMGEVLEDKDFPVEIDLAAGVIRIADGTAPASAETPAQAAEAAARAAGERPAG